MPDSTTETATDQAAIERRLAEHEQSADGSPSDSERRAILAGRCGPLRHGGPCWLMPGHRGPHHGYEDDVAAVITQARAADTRPVADCGGRHPGSCSRPLGGPCLQPDLPDPRARAANTGDRETLERVRALPGEWQAATCITDGAPCSFHRHAQGYADDLRAALASEPRRDNEQEGT